jgi:hypothetical protein
VSVSLVPPTFSGFPSCGLSPDVHATQCSGDPIPCVMRVSCDALHNFVQTLEICFTSRLFRSRQSALAHYTRPVIDRHIETPFSLLYSTRMATTATCKCLTVNYYKRLFANFNTGSVHPLRYCTSEYDGTRMSRWAAELCFCMLIISASQCSTARFRYPDPLYVH